MYVCVSVCLSVRLWTKSRISRILNKGNISWVNHVIKEVNIKEALKSSIFIVQKAAAPKSGVEFRQDSIGTIRNSLATSCDA